MAVVWLTDIPLCALGRVPYVHSALAVPRCQPPLRHTGPVEGKALGRMSVRVLLHWLHSAAQLSAVSAQVRKRIQFGADSPDLETRKCQQCMMQPQCNRLFLPQTVL